MPDKHKAPAQVTIARTEEETPLQAFVMRYWPHALGVALVVTAAILVSVWSEDSSEEEVLAGWARLGQDLNLAQGFSPPSATILADVAEDLADQPAGPWAKAVEVGRRLEDGDIEGARRAARELQSTWPEHPLATQGLFPRAEGEEGPPRPLIDHLEADVAALQGWEEQRPSLFSNPPLPEDAPKVKLVTSAGDLVIGLYREQAPFHTENFLKLCGEGFYDGILFHRVIQGFMIQAGDPNTRDAEATDTWGQGGPGYTIAPEIGSLWHFTGAVAAAKMPGDTESSGSQFYVMTGANHTLDGDYTVFGALVEGQDVVTSIETAPVLGDRPTEPVTILSTEVL
jgi:cyclophilin family peptidyl-prolyl cis-trans isomerase